jgi:hypothetical protein
VTAPVEVTTRYATTTADLPGAWAFVMDHIESVGPDPSIHITPMWTVRVHDIDDELEHVPRHFSVVVEGMVEKGTES